MHESAIKGQEDTRGRYPPTQLHGHTLTQPTTRQRQVTHVIDTEERKYRMTEKAASARAAVLVEAAAHGRGGPHWTLSAEFRCGDGTASPIPHVEQRADLM